MIPGLSTWGLPAFLIGLALWRLATMDRAVVDGKIRHTVRVVAERRRLAIPLPEGHRPAGRFVLETLGQLLVGLAVVTFALFLFLGDTVETDRLINRVKADVSAWWGGQ